MSDLCKNIIETNYKQPAGTIFTEWKSAGLYGVDDKNTVSKYPLKSANNLVNPEIILSNNNNVRNNFQNHKNNFLNSNSVYNDIALNYSNNNCNISQFNL